MSRRNIGLFLVILLGAGCAAQPLSPSVAVPPIPSQGIESSPSAPTASPSSAQPVESSAPVATFPPSTPAAGVPTAIERIGWAGRRAELGQDGSVLQWHIYAGLLNHPPTMDDVIPGAAGYPSMAVAADTVTIATAADGMIHLMVRSAVDGTALADIRRPGVEVRTFRTDAARSLLYAAITKAQGGLEIRRFAFDGSIDELLVKLDKRFSPEGIPTERFDLAIDQSGVLIVEACGKADGCRLWEIPPTATKAASPRTLPGHPPIVCSMVGATQDWIVVADDATCFVDTADAPIPYRAIRRSDGVSHLITDDHVGAGRLIESPGNTLLVAADPSYAGATVEVVTYDIESMQREVLLRGLAPTAEQQTMTVSGVALPGSWVLLQPWFIENSSLPTIPARLLNLDTRKTIELPIGTSGWS